MSTSKPVEELATHILFIRALVFEGAKKSEEMSNEPSTAQLPGIPEFPDTLQYLPPNECKKVIDFHVADAENLNRKGI